jgi:hypothetical protein
LFFWCYLTWNRDDSKIKNSECLPQRMWGSDKLRTENLWHENLVVKQNIAGLNYRSA